MLIETHLISETHKNQIKKNKNELLTEIKKENKLTVVIKKELEEIRNLNQFLNVCEKLEPQRENKEISEIMNLVISNFDIKKVSSKIIKFDLKLPQLVDFIEKFKDFQENENDFENEIQKLLYEIFVFFDFDKSILKTFVENAFKSIFKKKNYSISFLENIKLKMKNKNFIILGSDFESGYYWPLLIEKSFKNNEIDFIFEQLSIKEFEKPQFSKTNLKEILLGIVLIKLTKKNTKIRKLLYLIRIKKSQKKRKPKTIRMKNQGI